MAIGITYKSGRANTTNTASSIVGTPTWTPAANSLLVAFVVTAYSSSPSDPTSVTGHGVTYSKLTLGTSTLSTTHQLSIWVGKAGASPTNAAPTANLTTTNGTGDGIFEFEITGADVSGTALQAIVHSDASNTGSSGTSATVTLAAASNNGNRAMTWCVQLDNVVPTAAGTWVFDTGAGDLFSLPATGVAAFHDNGTFNTAGAATVTNNKSWRMVAVEIKYAAATHATSGDLAAQAAVVAGTAQDRFTTSGALADAAAAVAGTAVHSVSAPSHPTSGALAAQAAQAAGIAQHRHAATGALVAAAATVAGTTAHQHKASGALGAGNAEASGAAAHHLLHATSGALDASAAAVAGVAQDRHTATGALGAGSATASGAAAHHALHATSGALGAAMAQVAGASLHPHTTSGALATSAAATSASAQRLAPGVNGDLHAQAAQITGDALRIGVHLAAGALEADAALVAGTSLHPRVAAGDVSAGAAALAGSATHPHIGAGVLATGSGAVVGDAVRSVASGEHAAAGDAGAGVATLAGSAEHYTAHVALAALAAGQATLASAATHPHVATGALTAGETLIAGEAVTVPAGTRVVSGALASSTALVGGDANHVSIARMPVGGFVGPSAPRLRKKHSIRAATLRAQPARITGAAMRSSQPASSAFAHRERMNEQRKIAALMVLALAPFAHARTIAPVEPKEWQDGSQATPTASTSGSPRSEEHSMGHRAEGVREMGTKPRRRAKRR